MCSQSVFDSSLSKMNRWTGKVAVVTGASGGIGAAISRALVKNGVKVVGLARRVDKLSELHKELGKGKFYPLECDVRKEEDILKVFQWVQKELGGVDILVNNAGVISGMPVIDSPTEEILKVIETNLIAPTLCAREAIQSMKKRKAPGHVININSVAGSYAETLPVPLGMYCPSKYGLRALGTELRHEIVLGKLNVKITNISPGAVSTDMFNSLAPAAGFANAPVLKDKDIAEAALYALGTPE
ncbi:farnesol dehydrogenase-like, partial [Ceratina calcarata]|uniref:Farnesol dehydrogenase-like n=1 Tax=Ceratina calcarata TaxID=156304 RepID=A0AAJ7N4B5_9HYME